MSQMSQFSLLLQCKAAKALTLSSALPLDIPQYILSYNITSTNNTVCKPMNIPFCNIYTFTEWYCIKAAGSHSHSSICVVRCKADIRR